MHGALATDFAQGELVGMWHIEAYKTQSEQCTRQKEILCARLERQWLIRCTFHRFIGNRKDASVRNAGGT